METIMAILLLVTLTVALVYMNINLFEDMDSTLYYCRSLLNKYQQMESLSHIIEGEVKMRSSALKVINILKKGCVTDPEIIKKLDEYMKDDDITRMNSLVSSNMKHYANMVSDIIDNLAALKKGVPSFLIPEHIKKGVDETITEANELWEKLYNYSNEYETDSNNQVPQLDRQ